MLTIAATLILLCALVEAQTTVTVDYGQPRQTVAGFGASITWLAGDLNNFSAANQTALLDALYSTSVPSAGLSIIRAGSMLCEFNPSAGVYNWNHPLIQGEIGWMHRVKSTYGVNQFLVTTWTPPAFMKSNNSCSNGGSVLTQYYPDLANTMVLWMQNAQTSLGQQVNVWSVQNEPSNSTSYDSANYTPAQFISFVTGYLKPAMLSAGLSTKIAVPEPSVWGGPSYFIPTVDFLFCRISRKWMPTWTSWQPTTMVRTPVWLPHRRPRSSTTSPCGRRKFTKAKPTTAASATR